MAIPTITPYGGGVANPDGSQTQPEFTQNMFDQLSYEAQLASELNATVNATNTTASEVNSNAIIAKNSADAAQAAANFEGNFTAGVTSAVKGKSYLYSGNVWLCLQNTTTTPSTGNAAWKLSVGEQYVTEAQEDFLPLGSELFRGDDGVYLKNGDTVPAGTTHLRVMIDGKPTLVAIAPAASGVVSSLAVFGCVIGGTTVYFEKIHKPLESTLEQFGGAADAYLEDGSLNPSKTDNYPALLRLIEYQSRFVPDRFGGDNNNSTIGKVKLGVGGYYFGTPLSMKIHSHIKGVGSGQAAGQQTIMLFEGDNERGIGECSGITYHRSDTDETSSLPVTERPKGGSDGSILEGVTVRAINRVYEPTVPYNRQRKCGAWRRARATFKDVQFERFGGHGYMTVASLGFTSDDQPYGNCNEWIDQNVRTDGNGYHGHFVSGRDANAGVATKESHNNNNGCGLWDESFLGNTYLGCHFNRNYRPEQYVTWDAGDGVKTWWCQDADLAATTEPGTNNLVWQQASAEAALSGPRPWDEQTEFQIGGAVYAQQHSIFVGTYVEKGWEGPIYLKGSCVWLEGLQEVDFSNVSTMVEDNFIVDSGYAFNPSFSRPPEKNIGTQSIRWLKERGQLFNFSDGQGNSQTRLKMHYITDPGELTANMIGFAAGSLDYGMMYVVNANKAGTYGLKGGDTFLYGDIKIGGANSPSIATNGDTGKYYHRGSIILNRIVSAAGQNTYEQCTVAGLRGSTAVFVPHTL